MNEKEKPYGCSGGVSWGWKFFTGSPPPFEDCCVKHDIIYRTGGTSETRTDADRKLRRCVAKGGYPVLAWVMWIAVRIGGARYFPTRMTWTD